MRGKRTKGYRSRGEKLCRRGALLLLLVLVNVTLGGYGLTPRDGIRPSEEVANLGRTEVIRSLGSTGIRGAGLSRSYLCANENGMLFALARFSGFTGWGDQGFAVIDCSQSSAVHSGTCSVSKLREGEDNWRWFLFGRVDAEEGVLLRAELGTRYGGPGMEWTTAETVEIPSSQWFEKDGHTYFLRELPRYDREEGRPGWDVRLTLTGGEGRILYQDIVAQGGSVAVG